MQKASWIPPSEIRERINKRDNKKEIFIFKSIKIGNIKNPARIPVHLAHSGN